MITIVCCLAFRTSGVQQQVVKLRQCDTMRAIQIAEEAVPWVPTGDDSSVTVNKEDLFIPGSLAEVIPGQQALASPPVYALGKQTNLAFSDLVKWPS